MNTKPVRSYTTKIQGCQFYLDIYEEDEEGNTYVIELCDELDFLYYRDTFNTYEEAVAQFFVIEDDIYSYI